MSTINKHTPSLFGNLGNSYQEMRRLFLTHHIFLSKQAIERYVRRSKMPENSDTMQFIYKILMENGFNPWTNKKEKRKKEPTVSLVEAVNVIRDFKVKPIKEKKEKPTYKAPKLTQQLDLRIMEVYINSQPKPIKKYERDYDKEAVARFMRKFNLTKEQAIEARNITKDKHRKKQWKNILNK